MSRSLKPTFVEQEVHLLVSHFGERRVRAALAKTLNDTSVESRRPNPKPPRQQNQAAPALTNTLDSIRNTEPEKFSMVSGFLGQVRDGTLLPEALDVRHFAQQVGLKEIKGKSRKELVSNVVRFLIQQPIEKLRIHLEKARGISELQRQGGFSVLTDKLLGDR